MKINFQKGISLIESVVYIAIFAMVFTVVVNTIAIVSTSFGKTRVKRSVITQGRLASERMIREIRLADSIDASASVFNSHPGTLKLNTIVSPSDETPTTREFFIQDGALVMREGGATDIVLTSRVNVSNLVFYDIDMSTLSEAARFDMTIESGSGRTHTERDFVSTNVLRRSY